jgi:hypothetical protein
MKAEDLKGMNGRKVLVEATITDPEPQVGAAVILTLGGGPKVACLYSAIREILPQEIKVGDRVTCEGYTGRVLHVDGPFAWIRTRLDENLVVRCDICTLIEPAQ